MSETLAGLVLTESESESARAFGIPPLLMIAARPVDRENSAPRMPYWHARFRSNTSNVASDYCVTFKRAAFDVGASMASPPVFVSLFDVMFGGATEMHRLDIRIVDIVFVGSAARLDEPDVRPVTTVPGEVTKETMQDMLRKMTFRDAF